MVDNPHAAESMTLLAFHDVTKRYRVGRDWIPVLEDVSFRVEEGDFIGVHGERRSGKSTLLRIAAGWEQPDDGGVVFDGHDLSHISGDARAKLRRSAGIGLTSGAWRPNCNKPTVQHVAEVLLSDRMSPREAQGPALRALERVGLFTYAHAPSNLLSQGELVRLGLAQRLVHKPRVLLMDEPAVGLRPSDAVELYELLSSLGRDPELALVIASEDLAPIRMATRMLSLDDGRLRSVTPPSSTKTPGTVVALPDRRTAAR
jgi:predicted ABC-type transport system involved in lysophospholipase L1 biosynthesis ATPase subunit